MGKDNDYVKSIMKIIKSSKTCAVIIVASIAIIALGSLTDSIDKVVKFSDSYINKTTADQKAVAPSSSKIITKQASTISMVIVAICICILFLSLSIFYTKYRKYRLKKVFFTHIYHFYTSVKNYVELYNSSHSQIFVKKQNKFLDELEKYIETNERKHSLKIVKQAKHLQEKLIKIVEVLWVNSHNADQTKKYETWKNIKFNIMKNEINPLYEQLKKNLT